jgi:PAS domain S-box-containing protein
LPEPLDKENKKNIENKAAYAAPGRGTRIGAQLAMLVIGVVAPLAVGIAYLSSAFVENQVKHGRADLQHLATQYANRLGRDIRDARTMLERIAAMPDVKAMDSAHCDPVFKSLPSLDPLIEQLALRRLDGRPVCSYRHDSPVRLTPETFPWFAAALAGDGFVASSAWFGHASKHWVTVLLQPVRDDAGRRVGFVVLPISLEALRARNLEDLPQGWAASVIGADGRFLLRSVGQDEWVGKAADSAHDSWQERRRVPGEHEMVGVDGVRRLRAAAQVPGTDWILVAGARREALVEQARAKARPAVVLGAALLVMMALGLYVFGRGIVRPVQRIGRAARAVADGDLDVRLDPAGPAELRDVAREFNRMLRAKVLIDRETHAHQQWASRVIENVGDLVAIVARDGTIRYVSPSVAQIGGYAPQELIGRGYLEFVHPDEHAEALAELEQILHTKDSVRVAEKRFRHKDGHWVALDPIARNALDDPTIGGIILNARDISERLRAQERLRVQATVLKTQQEASLDGILLVDENARIVSYNRPFIELWGVPGKIVQAGDDAPLLQWVTDQVADPEAFVARVRHLYAHREEKSSEEVRCKDGRIVDRYSAPVAGADGRYYGRVWYFRDVTAQRRAEAALAESEAKFRGLVEQTLTGIYIIQQGRFVYVNPHLADLFGYSPGELTGKPFPELVAESDRALVAENIRRRIAGEIKSVQYEFRGRRKDGSSFDVGVHGSRSVYNGQPAVIGLLQDITQRRKAEKQSRIHLAELEQAMMGTIEAVSTMVELRDPYTSGHERRVGELAWAIGQEMGLDADQVKGLRIAGALHDIGKIACPAEILSKPARLTPIEYEIVKAHPQLGFDILKSVHFAWPVAQTILQHHERIDGSGYPHKLKDGEIILPARILAVADTIEAMGSHRPYRPALGIDAALAEVEKHSGTLFDPQVVAACLRLFHEKNYVLPA